MKKDRTGSALILTLISLAILAFVGASFIKNSNLNVGLTSVDSKNTLQRIEADAEIARVRQMLMKNLDDYTQPNALTIDVDVETIPFVNDPTKFAEYIQEFETAYNNTHAGKVSIKCVRQGDSGTGTEEFCTRKRSHDPKIFSISYQKLDPERGVLSTIKQESFIQRAQINDFSYLITNAKGDIRLGKANFSAAVGIFVDSSLIVSGVPVGFNGIYFTSPQGTNFTRGLSTNIPDERYLIQEPGAVFTLNDATFGDNDTVRDVVNKSACQFYSMSHSSALTINPIDTTTQRTAKEQAAWTACETQQAGNPDLVCDVSQLGKSSYEITNDGRIRLNEVWQWTLTNTTTNVIEKAGTYGASDGAGFTDFVSLSAGKAYYLPGEVSVGAPFTPLTSAVPWESNSDLTSQKESHLSERVTLMAGGDMIIRNSIRGSGDPVKNSALFAQGNIKLSDRKEQNQAFVFSLRSDALLVSGNYQRINGSGGTAYTLQQIKKATTNYTSSTISAYIEASIFPTATSTTNCMASGSIGSFIVPGVFYDVNSENGSNPRTLGKLFINGMVITAEPTYTSQKHTINTWEIASAGFTDLEMRADNLQSPPPGMNFSVNSNLKESIGSSSTFSLSMKEALSSVQY